MNSKIFHHIFALMGTAFYTLVCTLLFQEGLLNLSQSQMVIYLVIFWLGNLTFSGLFFLPLSENIKYKFLVLLHVLWGQVGLVALGFYSPEVIEISLMMSLATFAFVVFGVASLKLMPLVIVTCVGFGSVLLSDVASNDFGRQVLVVVAYSVAAIFITVINAYVGNLHLFLSNQNALIKAKSAELEQVHDELLQAKEEAESSSSSKTRFLAAASHDLRQPLHALELYIEALPSQDENSRRHVISQMEKSAFELRELLNCLFDISRFDANVAEVNIHRVRLDQIIQDLDVEFKELSAKEGRELTIRSSHAVVETDPVLMHRIIRNLVTNALKHSGKGRVLMGFRKRGDYIRCEVWDSGVGIAEKDQDKIFEEFYQAKNSNRDRAQGLGLGLALIKRMCHSLDHEFGMRSIEGKGTKFWVDMKMSLQADACVWGQMPDVADGGQDIETILCIDDEESILNGLALVLKDWGYKVLAATSADEAINRLSMQGDTPAAIVCDFRLADNQNGIDALVRINRFLRLEVPGIIVTGDLDQSIEDRAKEFGYKVLLKPLSPAKLKLFIKNMTATVGAN